MPLKLPWASRRREEPAGGGACSERVLYHQTSHAAAAAILDCGHMKPGPPGFGGPGIYFAAEPGATSLKANHHGVILECVVRLGRVRRVTRPGDWSGRLRQRLLRYDTVALTWLEGGVEYVCFSPKQVVSIKIHCVLHPDSSRSLGATSSSGSMRIPAGVDPSGGSFDGGGSSSSDSSEAGSCCYGDSRHASINSRVNSSSSVSTSTSTGATAHSSPAPHLLSAAGLAQHALAQQRQAEERQEQEQQCVEMLQRVLQESGLLGCRSQRGQAPQQHTHRVVAC